MPDDFRVTIRLASDLYAQLAARGRQGQPLAAIVREALEDYLSRQPDLHETTLPLEDTLAAMAATIASLCEEIASLKQRVDTLAAFWQPPTATSGSQPAATRQPRAASAAATPVQAFDPTRYHLGTLCQRGHGYLDTGQSLRRTANGACVACDTEGRRARRAVRRQGRG